MVVETGAELARPAGRFDSAQKTHPSHGIENSLLNQVHVVARDRGGIAGLAAEALLDELTQRILSFGSRIGEAGHQNSWSHSRFGSGNKVSSMSQQRSAAARLAKQAKNFKIQPDERDHQREG